MIFLTRQGTELGGFTPDEVRAGLASGRFLPTDFFFVEGMTAWRTLAEWEGAAAGRSRGRGALKPVLIAGCASLLLAAVVAAVVLLAVWLRPAKPVPKKTRPAFVQALSLFRTGMLHDWEATLHRYADAASERQFAEWSVELWAPIAADVGWSYWFNTSVLTAVDAGGDRPRTAFYHPWSDTFWLAEWSLQPKPHIVKGWFGAGDVLRSPGKPPWQATPLWLRGHGPRADALAAALARSIPAAERALQSGAWPDRALSSEASRRANLSLSRMPLLEIASGLAPLRHPVADEDAAIARLRAAFAALRRGTPAAVAARLRDAPENTPEARTLLDSIPPALASSLQPVCRLGAGDTAYIVLMPSQASDVALATLWDARASGARLVRVDVLPFAELLEAARSGVRKP